MEPTLCDSGTPAIERPHLPLKPERHLFGAGAQIDVGGLLATTLQIRDDDFMAGRYLFTKIRSRDSVQSSIAEPSKCPITDLCF
jgi:hypothetical protein